MIRAKDLQISTSMLIIDSSINSNVRSVMQSRMVSWEGGVDDVNLSLPSMSVWNAGDKKQR